jgi:hypothetical protein
VIRLDADAGLPGNTELFLKLARSNEPPAEDPVASDPVRVAELAIQVEI